MATVTVELDDAVYERLVAEAAVADGSVGELIAALATTHAAEAGQARDAAHRHLKRYPRLFKRFAE